MSNNTQQTAAVEQLSITELTDDQRRLVFDLMTGPDNLSAEEAVAVLNAQRNLKAAGEGSQPTPAQTPAVPPKAPEQAPEQPEQASEQVDAPGNDAGWVTQQEVSIPIGVMDSIVMDFMSQHMQMDGKSKYIGKKYYGHGRGNGYVAKFFGGNIRIEHVKKEGGEGQ